MLHANNNIMQARFEYRYNALLLYIRVCCLRRTDRLQLTRYPLFSIILLLLFVPQQRFTFIIEYIIVHATDLTNHLIAFVAFIVLFLSL